MRIMIKGGVWKNSEDEILKAAVMKYGLNQWARISSLLVRKSAKQCKARWFEWLDPAIKKTEWTREEDEKLLHLAKLMPTQWRTIAPIVGRTAAQCLDRYEKLLDQVLHKEGGYDRSDDPRRLRPGEIDPNPESKPARPDPVDMDEDEKEMLSEARARLANTRGKKAKRKAREKQLEEARRLANLQKRRELKAAGIELRGKWKRKRGIDYNAEVAFETKPSAGFYDTAEEMARTKELKEEFRPLTVEEIEGKRRRDIEQALVKRDIGKAQMKERHDMPAAVAKAQALNEATMIRRRTKMMLPSPQVSEQELQQIAQMGSDSELAAARAGGSEATQHLMGEYGHTPGRGATPMRVPRTPAPTVDRVMTEAENLARLEKASNPLMGGEQVLQVEQSDFSGVTPRNQVVATPNPLATPSIGGVDTGATPSRAGSGSIAGLDTPSVAGTPLPGGRGASAGPTGATPAATPLRGGATPLRDELGLNQGDWTPLHSKQQERVRQRELRQELRSGLDQLPAPQHAYTVELPELPDDKDAAGESMEEDATDVLARHRRQEEQEAEQALKKRSVVIQRSLPRPASTAGLPPAAAGGAGPREAAEALVAAELALLLQHDLAKYPLSSKRKEKKRKRPAEAVPELADFELEELQEQYEADWQKCVRDFVWVPSKKSHIRLSQATNVDRLEAVKDEFERARKEMQKEAAHAGKLASKCDVLTLGLKKRSSMLQESLLALHSDIQQAVVDLECYEVLRDRESTVLPARLAALEQAVQAQRAREHSLQGTYKELLTIRDDLHEQLTAAAATAAPASEPTAAKAAAAGKAPAANAAAAGETTAADEAAAAGETPAANAAATSEPAAA